MLLALVWFLALAAAGLLVASAVALRGAARLAGGWGSPASSRPCHPWRQAPAPPGWLPGSMPPAPSLAASATSPPGSPRMRSSSASRPSCGPPEGPARPPVPRGPVLALEAGARCGRRRAAPPGHRPLLPRSVAEGGGGPACRESKAALRSLAVPDLPEEKNAASLYAKADELAGPGRSGPGGRGGTRSGRTWTSAGRRSQVPEREAGVPRPDLGGLEAPGGWKADGELLDLIAPDFGSSRGAFVLLSLDARRKASGGDAPGALGDMDAMARIVGQASGFRASSNYSSPEHSTRRSP